MRYSSVHHHVVFLLSFASITVLTLDFTSVKAKLHQSVDLTCEHECSGLVKWVMGNQQELLAHCNQTSCSSNKGYQISHHQKRNVLTVMEADYTKRTFFACECNTEDICHVRLCIEPVKSSVQLNPGEDLILMLPVPEPVEVIYNSSGSHEQICTVVSRLQCKDEYTQRVSLRYPNLTLERLNVSDSGDYTVRDIKNDEVIHVYTVFVEGPDTPKEQTSAVPAWVIGLMVVLMVLVGGGVAVIMYPRRRKVMLQQSEHSTGW
ncbi:uncharacterized protein LOC128610603 [Ictalurus furcatus]|uniref:uncharacterized protein LOC128610603 n=1 Tax=Ictalurus furcatus TaxID=66913 RepID=UPI00235070EF|nr:uncharacterized protein LOC128610603 [Ictalurus furcatus]XP_053485996.1 uncharacterized protein LOC128610603 [Ictalurus furcatus]